MNKLLKSTFTVVALTASCWGAWRMSNTFAYYNDDLLLSENIEAMSQSAEEDEYITVVDAYGTCWVDEVTKTWDDTDNKEHKKHRWKQTGKYQTCQRILKSYWLFDPNCQPKNCSGTRFEKGDKPDPLEYQE